MASQSSDGNRGRSGYAAIVVMQPTQHREGDDLPVLDENSHPFLK